MKSQLFIFLSGIWKLFYIFSEGHLIEGDMTPKQMVIAIDNYLDDIKQAEIEEVQR